MHFCQHEALALLAAIPCARWVWLWARQCLDTAHQLAQNPERLPTGIPFAATYWIRNDGIVQFSLRSIDGGADVSEIAKSYGGGGHKHAAGFQVPLSMLVEMLEQSAVMP